MKNGSIDNSIVMNSDEAVERVIGVLRQRMQDAIKEKRAIRLHARAGIKEGAPIVGVDKIEEDGSFAFTMLIDRRAC